MLQYLALLNLYVHQYFESFLSYVGVAGSLTKKALGGQSYNNEIIH